MVAEAVGTELQPVGFPGWGRWGAYSLAEDGVSCGLGVSNLRISAGCSECTPLSQFSFLTKPQFPHYIGKNIQAHLGLTRLYFVALSMAVAGTDSALQHQSSQKPTGRLRQARHTPDSIINSEGDIPCLDMNRDDKASRPSP